MLSSSDPDGLDVLEQLRRYVTQDTRAGGLGSARQAASLGLAANAAISGANAGTRPGPGGITQQLWIFDYDEYPRDDESGDGWFFGDEPLDEDL
jgi:hypothetical protein